MRCLPLIHSRRRYPKLDIATYVNDAAAGEFTAWVASIGELSRPLHFTVFDNQTRSPVGTLALMRIDPKMALWRWDVHFSPLLGRTPMSTEARSFC